MSAVDVGILASVAGAGLLVLHSRYPTTTARLFFIEDTQTDDCTSRQLYDYSPGPLDIGVSLIYQIHVLCNSQISGFVSFSTLY